MIPLLIHCRANFIPLVNTLLIPTVNWFSRSRIHNRPIQKMIPSIDPLTVNLCIMVHIRLCHAYLQQLANFLSVTVKLLAVWVRVVVVVFAVFGHYAVLPFRVDIVDIEIASMCSGCVFLSFGFVWFVSRTIVNYRPDLELELGKGVQAL